MGHEYMYEIVWDSYQAYPLEPGLRLGALDINNMLDMETISEGSLLRKRADGNIMVVKRDRGKLVLKAAGSGRTCIPK